MYPFARLSSSNLFSSFCSFHDIGYIFSLKLAGASSVNSILWSHGRAGGKFFTSSSENKAACCLNSSGRVTCSFGFSLAYLWAILMAVFARLISTRPPCISAEVTPDHGGQTALVTVKSSSWVVLRYSLMCWYFPWRSVSTLILGPLRREFSQSMSGLKS